MKANFLALGLFGLAGASAVLPRDYPTEDYQPTKPAQYQASQPTQYKPAAQYHASQPAQYKPKQQTAQQGYPTYKSSPARPTYQAKKPVSYPTNNDYNRDASTTYPDSEQDYESGYTYNNQQGGTSSWRPKSSDPEFFNLRVDQACTVTNGVAEDPTDCPFNNYAIRLEGGIFIATPYDNFYDPKLPIFFVDDDTQMYTVSKDPLQVYIDGVTGALMYTKIGWLPPNAIGISFYHTGNNPLDLVDPSPSYLSWPSTQGASFFGSPWILCPLGSTLQFQVFINSENFGIGGPAGVAKDAGACVAQNLAATNANPWTNTAN